MNFFEAFSDELLKIASEPDDYFRDSYIQTDSYSDTGDPLLHSQSKPNDVQAKNEQQRTQLIKVQPKEGGSIVTGLLSDIGDGKRR